MNVLAAPPQTGRGLTAPSDPTRYRRRLLPRAWPITLLLVGFPVLWALGLSAFATQIVAIPMAIELVRRRPIKVPAGFGIWILFLLCSAVGFLVLGVNPPGTVPDSFAGRLIGYGVRETSYIAITIVLLYVGNLTERELSERRLIRQLSFFFVTVTVGGVLGLIWPNFSFTSLFELFVPGSIRAIPYVGRLIHPAFAQVQELGGDLIPRPAAPFAFTNTWGSQLSLLGIWFVVGWLVAFSRSQRVLALLVGVAAAIALVYSVNRGAWLGVVLGIVFVVVVLAIRGHLVPLAGLLIAMIVGTQVFLHSPLQDIFQTRAQNGVSNDIRSFTTKKAFELSARSPVIGFGSTRSAVGSATSIAIGRTPSCPTCGNVSIGINGSFFTLLVSSGFGGVVLFFGFWGHQAWRSRRDRSLVGIACQLTLLTAAFYSFFYTIELTVPFVVLALMWRRRATNGRNGDRAQPSYSPGTDSDRGPARGMRSGSPGTTP